MFNKNSQVGIFVIIGMILILIGIFSINIFFNNSRDNLFFEEKLLEIQSVKDYVGSCVEENSVLGIYLLSYQGGFIYNYNPSLVAEDYSIAYHLKKGNYTYPSKEFMEKELSRFMESGIELCLQNFDLNYLNISLEKANVTTKISRTFISFDISFPIVISKEEEKISLKKFSHREEVRLGHLLNIKKDVLEKFKKSDPYLDLEDLTIYDTDVSFGSYNKDSLIFTLTDNLSSKKGKDYSFNMATQSSSNSLPTMNFIPDVVLDIGQEFNYNLSGYDIDLDDSLIFYSKTNNVLVDKNSGHLKFLGENEVSNTNVEVCVQDDRNLKDCQIFKIMVRKNDY